MANGVCTFTFTVLDEILIAYKMYVLLCIEFMRGLRVSLVHKIMNIIIVVLIICASQETAEMLWNA